MDKNVISRYITDFHGAVFRLAYSYTRNRHDSEDISQEAFLRLYLSEKDFPTDGDVKAWLMRVTVNLCKDMLKSKWRRDREELSEDIPCESVEESLLADCVKRLEPKYSAVIHLFYYEGYSVKEIAEISRISATTVTTRLSRARKQLKKMLTENERTD